MATIPDRLLFDLKMFLSTHNFHESVENEADKLYYAIELTVEDYEEIEKSDQ